MNCVINVLGSVGKGGDKVLRGYSGKWESDIEISLLACVLELSGRVGDKIHMVIEVEPSCSPFICQIKSLSYYSERYETIAVIHIPVDRRRENKDPNLFAIQFSLRDSKDSRSKLEIMFKSERANSKIVINRIEFQNLGDSDSFVTSILPFAKSCSGSLIIDKCTTNSPYNRSVRSQKFPNDNIKLEDDISNEFYIRPGENKRNVFERQENVRYKNNADRVSPVYQTSSNKDYNIFPKNDIGNNNQKNQLVYDEAKNLSPRDTKEDSSRRNSCRFVAAPDFNVVKSNRRVKREPFANDANPREYTPNKSKFSMNKPTDSSPRYQNEKNPMIEEKDSTDNMHYIKDFTTNKQDYSRGSGFEYSGNSYQSNAETPLYTQARYNKSSNSSGNYVGDPVNVVDNAQMDRAIVSQPCDQSEKESSRGKEYKTLYVKNVSPKETTSPNVPNLDINKNTEKKELVYEKILEDNIEINISSKLKFTPEPKVKFDSGVQGNQISDDKKMNKNLGVDNAIENDNANNNNESLDENNDKINNNQLYEAKKDKELNVENDNVEETKTKDEILINKKGDKIEFQEEAVKTNYSEVSIKNESNRDPLFNDSGLDHKIDNISTNSHNSSNIIHSNHGSLSRDYYTSHLSDLDNCISEGKDEEVHKENRKHKIHMRKSSQIGKGSIDRKHSAVSLSTTIADDEISSTSPSTSPPTLSHSQLVKESGSINPSIFEIDKKNDQYIRDGSIAEKRSLLQKSLSNNSEMSSMLELMRSTKVNMGEVDDSGITELTSPILSSRMKDVFLGEKLGFKSPIPIKNPYSEHTTRKVGPDDQLSFLKRDNNGKDNFPTYKKVDQDLFFESQNRSIPDLANCSSMNSTFNYGFSVQYKTRSPTLDGKLGDYNDNMNVSSSANVTGDNIASPLAYVDQYTCYSQAYDENESNDYYVGLQEIFESSSVLKKNIKSFLNQRIKVTLIPTYSKHVAEGFTNSSIAFKTSEYLSSVINGEKLTVKEMGGKKKDAFSISVVTSWKSKESRFRLLPSTFEKIIYGDEDMKKCREELSSSKNPAVSVVSVVFKSGVEILGNEIVQLTIDFKDGRRARWFATLFEGLRRRNEGICISRDICGELCWEFLKCV